MLNSKELQEDLPYVKVIYFNEDEKYFVFDAVSAGKLLLDPAFKDKPVVVISVAGAFRKGKSFLLNFFLRYLKFVCKHGFTDSTDWMGTLDEPLTGFPWRGGSDRETEGILIWGTPSCVKLPDGQEIVVLLMDTQGAFDTQSTVKECATIFAVSTMLSSFQIYNITGNFQEDYLSHLHLFTEYGRIALQDTDSKPFQDLLFLIRDWSYPYEYNYGYSPELLKKRLAINPAQHNELICVRTHIMDCFENVELFLLPFPGFKVAITPNFDGNLSEIDETFRFHLSQLITSVISPSKLRPKKSQGLSIKCGDLLTFFDSYVKIFQSNTLPEPKNIMEATAEANNLVAVNSAKQLYLENMNDTCGTSKPYIPSNILQQKHDKYFNESLLCYNQAKKFGGDALLAKYRMTLELELSVEYDRFVKINQSKQVNSFKFVITAFVLCVIAFLIGNILDVVGLDPLMMPFNIVSLFLLSLIIFCLYAQFSGNYPQVLYQLNLISDAFLVKVISFYSYKTKTFMIDKYFKHSKTD